MRIHLGFAVILAALFPWAGCTGWGIVHTMPYTRDDLPEDAALIRNTRVQEAYWWQDDEERLKIAVRSRQWSLLGAMFSQEYALSIVLDDLPAGSEKLYKVTVREIQSRLIARGERRRSRSMLGVVVIHAPEHGLLEGRFHVLMHQQHFTPLTGWTPPSVFHGPRLVVAGTFCAIHDSRRGREILALTEEGFERPVPRTKRPPFEKLEVYPSTQPGAGKRSEDRPEAGNGRD